MTVADPHGQPRDFIRSCYVSWMRVPDHEQPIRVRWYKIPDPPPGSYPMGGFSSSDWDEDPKSYDPELGEESTSRNPFVDWRDCQPPGPLGWECPASINGNFGLAPPEGYLWANITPTVTGLPSGFVPFNGQDGRFFADGPHLFWDLEIDEDAEEGQLTAVYGETLTGYWVALYDWTPYVPGEPLVLPFAGNVQVGADPDGPEYTGFPPTITVNRKTCTTRGTEKFHHRLTENGIRRICD